MKIRCMQFSPSSPQTVLHPASLQNNEHSSISILPKFTLCYQVLKFTVCDFFMSHMSVYHTHPTLIYAHSQFYMYNSQKRKISSSS